MTKPAVNSLDEVKLLSFVIRPLASQPRSLSAIRANIRYNNTKGLTYDYPHPSLKTPSVLPERVLFQQQTCKPGSVPLWV